VVNNFDVIDDVVVVVVSVSQTSPRHSSLAQCGDKVLTHYRHAAMPQKLTAIDSFTVICTITEYLPLKSTVFSSDF